MSRPIPNRVHGTANGYSNWGCRCCRCRAANATKTERWKASKRNEPTPDHVHGTDNGYTNYGCRCRPCTSAHTDSSRNRRTSTRSRDTEGGS